jgi:hypothetical protein
LVVAILERRVHLASAAVAAEGASGGADSEQSMTDAGVS